MKKISLFLLVAFLVTEVFNAVYAEGLKKDDVLYARYGLRGEGNTIFYHNMSSCPIVIPLGTEVKVVGLNKDKITVQMVDDAKIYQILAFSNCWDKYFVRDKNEIGLESVSADKKISVKSSQVVEGMTKQEVYLSKGCPAYIGYAVKSYMHSFGEVMQSDVWYYNVNSRLKDAVITFKD